jgi:glycosyltransferase involved in cell wall biosynthesis
MAKIVIDARESGTSTGRYIDKLIEYLHKAGSKHQFVILTKAKQMDFIKSIAPKFEVVESNFPEYTFAEQLGFLKQLRDQRADLVHFGMTQQPVLYMGKKVTTIHDLTTVRFNNPAKNPLAYWFKQQVYKWVIRRVAHGSAHLMTPSEYVKEDVARFASINSRKMTVTYEAADKIADSPEPVLELEGKKFIMYVGRPTPHKNLERLVEAFTILRNQNTDLVLALAGKTDRNYSAIARLVKRKGLSESVVFTDFISEGQLRWMYENTAAYVFPSLSEGFGLPGLEAMVHKAPVVSSNATCLPEIYGEAAHYFDPVDPQDMAVKIAAVVNSPELREELIKNGLKQSAKYSWSAMSEQTFDIYNSVLS